MFDKVEVASVNDFVECVKKYGRSTNVFVWARVRRKNEDVLNPQTNAKETHLRSSAFITASAHCVAPTWDYLFTWTDTDKVGLGIPVSDQYVDIEGNDVLQAQEVEAAMNKLKAGLVSVLPEAIVIEGKHEVIDGVSGA